MMSSFSATIVIGNKPVQFAKVAFDDLSDDASARPNVLISLSAQFIKI